MLRLPFLFSFLLGGVFLISPICHSEEYQSHHQIEESSYRWAEHFLDCVEDALPVETLIDQIVYLRNFLELYFDDIPSYEDLFFSTKKHFEDEGIIFEDEELQDFVYCSLQNRKSEIKGLSNKDKKKKSKTSPLTKAFYEFLGGALLCVLPIPGSSAIGGGLMLDATRRALGK